MIGKMSQSFLDVSVIWKNQRTGIIANAVFTRNTYNLPYFMDKALNDAIKSGDKHGQTLVNISIREGTGNFPGMY